jgi:MFS family permease
MDGGSVRHNVVALGLDYSCFVVGMSFASQATILPAFATHLGASTLAIGAIPALITLGWFLPSLFTAHHTERLPRKLPFVLRYTVWERVPMVVLAAVAWLVAEPSPGLALWLFFALLFVMSATGGALMPAWMDIIGRAIPTTLRGRFFGIANVAASGGGLLGSALTAWFLAAFAPPQSYALCFLAGSVLLAGSYVALASVREPQGAVTAPSRSLAAYLRTMPAVLHADRDLRWFVIARAVGTLGAMATGFYTVYALREFAAAEWQVAAFTTLLLAGQVVGNLVLGWLADRTGHRTVLVLGLAALGVGNGLACAAASAGALGPVFVLLGIYNGSIHISSRTILLELAREGERPTYIGLVNTALAPVTFTAPLAAGLLADRLGFSAVFALAAALSMVALVTLRARVREPRRAMAGYP